jgi:hypothetical protein
MLELLALLNLMVQCRRKLYSLLLIQADYPHLFLFPVSPWIFHQYYIGGCIIIAYRFTFGFLCLYDFCNIFRLSLHCLCYRRFIYFFIRFLCSFRVINVKPFFILIYENGILNKESGLMTGRIVYRSFY